MFESIVHAIPPFYAAGDTEWEEALRRCWSSALITAFSTSANGATDARHMSAVAPLLGAGACELRVDMGPAELAAALQDCTGWIFSGHCNASLRGRPTLAWVKDRKPAKVAAVSPIAMSRALVWMGGVEAEAQMGGVHGVCGWGCRRKCGLQTHQK